MMEEFINKIICGDAMETMKKMPDKSIDLVITSPPYNLGNPDKWRPKTGKKQISPFLLNGYANYHDDLPYEQYVSWQRACLSEMLRLIKEDGAIFYNHKWRVQGGLLQDRQDIVSGFPVRQIIIWQKSGGINFRDSFFLPTYEVIYLICKPKFKLLPKANAFTDVWRFTQEKNDAHPCPFPLALPDKIIRATGARLVLDPFSGSGTTALAAKNLNREYIGIELSPDYCKAADERLRTLCSKQKELIAI